MPKTLKHPTTTAGNHTTSQPAGSSRPMAPVALRLLVRFLVLFSQTHSTAVQSMTASTFCDYHKEISHFPEPHSHESTLTPDWFCTQAAPRGFASRRYGPEQTSEFRVGGGCWDHCISSSSRAGFFIATGRMNVDGTW